MRQQKNKKLIPLAGFLLIAIIVIGGIKFYKGNLNTLSSDPVLICHAMGGLKGAKYSNSLEAFEKNYKEGFRVFEVDITTTSDNILVLRHDWTRKRGQKGLLKEKGYIPTYEEFMSTPLYGKYTPLSLADLFHLMKTHKDMYVITDTKKADYDTIIKQFKNLYKTAEEADALACLDRLIIQIYNDKMYDAVTSIYPFKNIIYTLYKRGTDNLDQLGQFCVEKNISIVTLNQKFYTDEIHDTLKKYGLKLYLHTVNDKEKALDFYKKGITGFYTDKLTPTDFR